MNQAFDVSKFRKNLTKNIKGISIGFRDPDVWIDTGNYTLNRLISGDFRRGVPLGKVTMFAGDSGAGKSFICAGNIVKNAQQLGILPILIDTENALDSSWLQALDVDVAEDKLIKANMSMIGELSKLVSNFVNDYRENYTEMEIEERPKILFVVDSLGMLMTETNIAQFNAGDLKGDMGIQAKQLKAFIKNCVNMFGDLNVGMVCTNHTYQSQDIFDPEDKITGGNGMIYASSIVVAMKKLKLKEDEDGKEVKNVTGIRAGCKVMKSRYSKPFESVEVKIPWDRGMDPYSGLVGFFEKQGLIKSTGKKLEYNNGNENEIIKLYRREWGQNEGGCLDILMDKFEEYVPKKEEEEEVEE